MRLQDWYYTRLYQVIYEGDTLEFNASENPMVFSKASEIEAQL